MDECLTLSASTVYDKDGIRLRWYKVEIVHVHDIITVTTLPLSCVQSFSISCAQSFSISCAQSFSISCAQSFSISCAQSFSRSYIQQLIQLPSFASPSQPLPLLDPLSHHRSLLHIKTLGLYDRHEIFVL